MNHLTYLRAVFQWILQTTWQAAVLAGLILLAQRLLRKRLSPAWRYGLWLLLVARLVIPTPPKSTVSIFNLTRTAPPSRAVGNPPPRGQFAPVTAAAPVVVIESPKLFTPGEVVVTKPPATPQSVHPAFSATSAAGINWFGIALYCWLAGVGFFGARLFWTNGRFRKRIGSYQIVADEAAVGLFDECRAAFKITQPIRLIESDEVGSPAVYGLWRKWLLLPDGVFERFSREELRCIFLHELAHIKRGDLTVNWLVAGLQVLHWFNPILWLAWSRMRADRELATDALALAHVHESDHTPYGETILKVLEGLSGARALPGLVGIVENKAQLKERLAAISRPAKSWKWVAILAAVLIAALGLTSAQTKTAAPEKPGEAQTSHRVVTNGAIMAVSILDAETGQPLSDAEVLAPNQAAFFSGQKENSPHWKTDKNGVAQIHLGDVPADHLKEMTWFTLSARHEGFAPRGLSWAAENKDVRPGMPAEATLRLERGMTIGGIVQDEQGAPAPGVGVRVHGTSYWDGLRHEYSEFWSDSSDSAPVLTDAQGQWQMNDFPKDLENIVITLSRDEGASQQFKHERNPGILTQEYGEPFSLADLRAGKLTLAVKAGFSVHGLVVDPAGKPLADVPVRAGFGMYNVSRLADTRTDAAGRFEYLHLLTRQLIVTVCPRDFAVTSTTIDLETNAPEARIQVAAVKPLRMRVVNGEGRPLAGAKILMDGWDQYRSEGQFLDFSAKTDSNGIAVWTNAPISMFAISAMAPEGAPRQKIRLAPDDPRDIVFKLRAGMDKEVVVTARAHDVATGAIVKLDSIHSQSPDREGFKGESETEGGALRLVVAAANFRQGGFYPMFQVETKATGYVTLISPWRDFDEGDWAPDFALEPIRHTTRVALLPDGAPAAGARFWSRFDERGGGLFMNQPGQLYGNGLANVRAGGDGGFELPETGEDETVIITHANGYLQTTKTELKNGATVRLNPYGGVRGVLKVAGQPLKGATVNIRTLDNYHYVHLRVAYTTSTGADGSFAFTSLPAGEYTLDRYRTGRTGPIIGDHQMPITIRAGGTLEVQYSNPGRQIVGQAAPENASIDVNWLEDDHTLTLKQPPLPTVNPRDYAGEKAYRAARDRIFGSAAFLQRERDARTYVLDFDSDGTFHANDVPPGKYELRIQVTKPESRQVMSTFPNPDNDLGLLARDVTVPPGDGPFDLGKLIVKIKDTGIPARPAAADFSGHTLTGQPVSLSQFRGKYLVLAFWATWSDRSTEQLESVRKLEEQLRQDDRVAFLGVSVEEDTRNVTQVVEKRGYRWTQAELDSDSLGKATGNFNVSSLPAIYLLDTKGRIVASNLDGDRLRATVQRELKH